MKPDVLGLPAKELYDQDFFEWAIRNAELLRAGRVEEADLGHIAEELEDMGKRERHELESRLRVLVTHFLKWQIQSERRSGSWRATIEAQRMQLDRLLRSMPSLRGALRKGLPEVYAEAIMRAAGETGLPKKMFPLTCPFELEQILDTTFFPD